jgi:hypothetical protein
MQVPICGQCRQSGLDCRGYSQGLVWIDPCAKTNLVQRFNHDGARNTISRQVDPVIQPDSLLRSARNQRLIGAFWSHYLPNGQQLTREASTFCPGCWTSVAIQLQDSEPALHNIILALGSGFMCVNKRRQNGTDADIHLLRLQTMQLYYRAIWNLKEAARDLHRLQSDSILVTTRLVQAYEVSISRLKVLFGQHVSYASPEVYLLQ